MKWAILAEIIDQLLVKEYLMGSLKTYMSSQLIGFEFSDGSRWFTAFQECPQESCLGPLLWSLVADKVVKQYNRSQRFIISYTDDSVVFEGADTRQPLKTKINRCFALFDKIATHLQLSLSAVKSTVYNNACCAFFSRIDFRFSCCLAFRSLLRTLNLVLLSMLGSLGSNI